MTELANVEEAHDHGDDAVADGSGGRGGDGDGGRPARRPEQLRNDLQKVIDQAIDRMRFIGRAVDRAQLSSARRNRDGSRSAGACAQFTEHEHALLAAWDGGNRALEPGPAFARRLIDAYHTADASGRPLDDVAERSELGDELADDPELAEVLARAHPCFDSADAREFRRIIEQHEDYLVRVARRLCGARDTAEDLVQDTLMRGWSSYGQFKPGTNVRSWLVTILTRLFLDQLKHAKVVRKAEPELRIRVVEPDADPQTISDAALWAAVRELEPELRDVLERAYVRGMRYREIASELEIPIGTIGTRLLRARERLRALLIDAADGSPSGARPRPRAPDRGLRD
jgi:RNA polymerase sigma-70 factor (ECF subfamily)